MSSPIPNDPAMLLSFLNTRLRDEYPSLEELCAALDLDRNWRPLTMLMTAAATSSCNYSDISNYKYSRKAFHCKTLPICIIIIANNIMYLPGNTRGSLGGLQ